MIPTMMLVGLVLGRWWRAALVIGTLAWPALLWAEGLIESPTALLASAALGLANTAVGVAVHQGVLAVVRRVRGRTPATAPVGP